MSYTVKFTDTRKTPITIPDGQLDETTNLTLVGRTWENYGGILDTNFLNLLENFANITPPDPLKAVEGQLWYDTIHKKLKVNADGQFKMVGGSYAGDLPPENSVDGDMWMDQSNPINNVLKVRSGGSWITIGPSAAAANVSGEVITDIFGVDHNVIAFNIDGTTYAILSHDSMFTPSPGINGFPAIHPGMNIASASFVPGNQFTGMAFNALKLGTYSDPGHGLFANAFMRTDVPTSTIGNVSIRNNVGLTIGANSQVAASINNNTFNLTNRIIDGMTKINSTDAGNARHEAIIIYGNGAVMFTGDIYGLGATHFSGGAAFNSLSVTGNIPSTSTGTGSIIVTENGGIGVGGNINTGGTVNTFIGNVLVGNSVVVGGTIRTGSPLKDGSLTIYNTFASKVGNLAARLGGGAADSLGLYNTTASGTLTLGTAGPDKLVVENTGNVTITGSVTSHQSNTNYLKVNTKAELGDVSHLKITGGSAGQVLLARNSTGDVQWEVISNLAGTSTYDYLFPQGDWQGTAFDYYTLGPVESANNHYDMSVTPPYRLYIVDLGSI